MNATRLTHEFRAYEVLVRHKDLHTHWGNWRLHSAYNTMEERDKAIDDLEETSFRQYKRHLNEYEFNAMLKAVQRREKEHNKLAEPAIPDIQPGMDVITFSPLTPVPIGAAKIFNCQLTAIGNAFESAFPAPLAEKTREIL